ncbi:hypothetical protein SAMN05444157_1703 [Frankineae bacterium MT45]|nr:hypothetical protein SAMN05444157_1703 [Frankineae bacterium MT45]
MRSQPAPPHIVSDCLTNPYRDPSRPWLLLLDDERPPEITVIGTKVVWSSLWLRRPDARIEFEPLIGKSGTDLRWTLYVDPPMPEEPLVGHMRSRLNELINANLRYSFGQ